MSNRLTTPLRMWLVAAAVAGGMLGSAALGQTRSSQYDASANTQPTPGGVPGNYNFSYGEADSDYGLPYISASRAASANAARLAAIEQVHLARVAIAARIADVQHERARQLNAAIRDQRQALDSYDQARDSALRDLQNNNDYKAAVAAKNNLQWVLAAGHLSPQDRLNLAVRKLNYAQHITQLEAQAMAKDGHVQDAQRRLNDVNNRVADARDAIDRAVRDDSQWQAARYTLDQAQVQAAAATGYLRGLGAAFDRNLDAYSWYNNGSYYNYGGYPSSYYYGYGYGGNSMARPPSAGQPWWFSR